MTRLTVLMLLDCVQALLADVRMAAHACLCHFASVRFMAFESLQVSFVPVFLGFMTRKAGLLFIRHVRQALMAFAAFKVPRFFDRRGLNLLIAMALATERGAVFHGELKCMRAMTPCACDWSTPLDDSRTRSGGRLIRGNMLQPVCHAHEGVWVVTRLTVEGILPRGQLLVWRMTAFTNM